MSHKIVPFVSKEDELLLLSESAQVISGLPSRSLNCPYHQNEVYTSYCYTDSKPICDICAIKDPNAPEDQEDVDEVPGHPPDPGHKGHHLKGLDKVVEQLLKEKQSLKEQVEQQFEKLDAGIQYFTGVEELFVK